MEGDWKDIQLVLEDWKAGGWKEEYYNWFWKAGRSEGEGKDITQLVLEFWKAGKWERERRKEFQPDSGRLEGERTSIIPDSGKLGGRRVKKRYIITGSGIMEGWRVRKKVRKKGKEEFQPDSAASFFARVIFQKSMKTPSEITKIGRSDWTLLCITFLGCIN